MTDTEASATGAVKGRDYDWHMQVGDRETAALLALLQARPGGASWGHLASEVAFEGSAEIVLARDGDEALFASPAVEQLIIDASEEIARWRAQGLRFVTVLDEEYPSRLLDIRETPPFLFYEGELRAEDLGMSVVGSREASPWGLDLAAKVAEFLVSEGLTVIAGLAAGIDTAAHRATLASGGRTVAFLGTGITHAYPTENAGLQREVASKGLVLSQFYPDAPPTKHTFPMRNASMSGYGLATVVIEAGEHSGTRIQARLAGEHGRPVILTSKVVDATSWGKALVGVPNVYIATSLGELKDTIREVLGGPGRLKNALAALAES